MKRRGYLKTSLVALTTTGLAGCLGGEDGDSNGESEPTGGSGAPSTGDGTTTGPTTTDGTQTNGGTNKQASPTVTVSSVNPFGKILTDSEGMTLYLFTRDKPDKSVCYGNCAAAWPPLLVEGDPTAGEGVVADIGTITRKDGSTQVTAGDHPLYYYVSDKQPGDTNGQGLKGVWYVLAPDGSKITSEKTTSENDGSGGGGYGGDGYY